MKHLYTVLGITLITSGIIAQPVITENNMPQNGDQPPIIYCSDAVVEATLDSETGNNYMWDFSGLTTESMEGFDFVDPSTTIWGSDFSSSNLCGIDDATQAHAYYSSSSDSLALSGLRYVITPGDTLEVDYSDPEKIVGFPFTSVSFTVDNFEGSGIAGGFPVTLQGTYANNANGYGTLILPNGTYDNVLRMRTERTETTFFQGVPSGTVSKTQWIWVSSDYRYWLLLMELVDDGFGVDDNVWYQTTPLPALNTGISENTQNDLTIYPNPVAANGTLELSRLLRSDESIQLFDTQGRMVMQGQADHSTIALEGVHPGIYLLNVTDASGSSISIQRLIVQ